MVIFTSTAKFYRRMTIVLELPGARIYLWVRSTLKARFTGHLKLMGAGLNLLAGLFNFRPRHLKSGTFALGRGYARVNQPGVNFSANIIYGGPGTCFFTLV